MYTVASCVFQPATAQNNHRQELFVRFDMVLRRMQRAIIRGAAAEHHQDLVCQHFPRRRGGNWFR